MTETAVLERPAKPAAPAVHGVIIERVGIGASGPRYSATYVGDVIVASSRNPEFDAARALLAIGVAGKMESRWAGASHAAMRFNSIEAAAGRTIEESSSATARLKNWKPFDAAKRARQAKG